MKPYHFYVAFNPLFNGDRKPHKTQAHEFHHALKERVTKNSGAHMYWGKIQVSQYSEPLLFENYQRVIKENDELQLDTHLYVTDYQHLWVGKVTEVLREIPDHENTLGFYTGKHVEIWFKLTDFELVSKDSSVTLTNLEELFVDNEYYSYKLKGLTPFTSGIRFPMIVQDRTHNRHFRDIPGTHRVLNDNPLIVSPDPSVEIGSFLQSFVIPEANFKRLPEVVKLKIFNAEILLLEAQAQGKSDRKKLERSILTYLSCLEMLLNETFVHVMRKEEGHRIYVIDEGQPKFLRSPLDKDKRLLVRLRDFKETFSLSQIKMLLDTPTFFNHTTLDYIFRNNKRFWEYCRLELRSTLKNEALVELKNQLGNGGEVRALDRELLLVRNILLGVGGKGVFNDIIENYLAVTEKKVA